MDELKELRDLVEELERLTQVALVDVPNNEGVSIKEPVKPEVMKSITVEPNGYTFGSVIKLIK